jgi:two-component system cell cycle sensor histidine kinase/response regulator CckA
MSTPRSSSSLVAALERLRPHDHLCSIYETVEEQNAVAIPFIRIGLERREKCLYIADEERLDAVREEMQREGIDVEGSLASGALVFTTKSETYLKQATFDPNWMFTFWEEAAEAAEREGFTSLRATGETEWVVRGVPGIERWLEYESRLTETLERANAFALCQYNRRKCSTGLLLNVIRTHPIVIYSGTVCRNFYFVPPEEFLGPDESAREVERLLTNIRDRERMDAEIQRANAELEGRVRERTAELSEANRRLAQREEWLRLAQEAAGVGVAEWDAATDLVRASDEICALYGVDAAVGKRLPLEQWLERVHADDRARVERELRTAANECGKWESEFRIVLPDGELRWIHGKAKPLLGPHGEISRLLVTNIDATALKREEEARYAAQRRESVGLLAGGVAHDFNNILTGVLGGASLLLDEVEGPARERVEAIMKSAERAADLTQQLLAYAGKGRIQVSAVDLSHAVAQMKDLIQASMAKKIRLELNLAETARVQADRRQVEQVLVNLAMNSAEALEDADPAAIRIATRMERLDEAAAGRRGIPAGAYVVLEVADNGHGMDEATRARAFDPFFTTRMFGRGMGLPAVAGIVRSYGGAVEIESAPGQGARVSLWWPAAAQEVRRPAAVPQESRPAILVVDDEQPVRDFMADALARRGHEVLIAENGAEALSILERRASDVRLVLLDIVMPRVGGGEALNEIRVRWPKLKILVTSGYNQAEAQRLCEIERGDGFIQKPYTAPQLAKAVAGLMGN